MLCCNGFQFQDMLRSSTQGEEGEEKAKTRSETFYCHRNKSTRFASLNGAISPFLLVKMSIRWAERNARMVVPEGHESIGFHSGCPEQKEAIFEYRSHERHDRFSLSGEGDVQRCSSCVAEQLRIRRSCPRIIVIEGPIRK